MVPKAITDTSKILMSMANGFFPVIRSIVFREASTAYVAGSIVVRIESHVGRLFTGKSASLKK